MKFLIPAILLFFVFDVSAQVGTQELPLKDLSNFQPQAGNWQIVNGVFIDPTRDIHDVPVPTDKKRKKQKKGNQIKPGPVSVAPGEGVLINLPHETHKDHLLTVWEHGDLELELEVMMPKGSNSGIYLQGRYEVQLLDSWGVSDPKFSDIGGIYRNWDNDPETSYLGKAPIVNAAKAPGLWQKLKISFRAPKFDALGNKVSNAHFNSVVLNGVEIHSNIDVPRSTGGPVGNGEVAKGPLMIQGDHGPVAFRNIRYRMMQDLDVSIENLQYKTYYNKFEKIEDIDSLIPDASGEVNQIDFHAAGKETDFAIVFNGDLIIPKTGFYRFTLETRGHGLLSINALKSVGSGEINESYNLEKGTYPIEIGYMKNESRYKPRLGLTVSSENGYPKGLHALGSMPMQKVNTAPILIEPTGNRARLLRAFLDFPGENSSRLTHTIGVGEPDGIHYIYDLKAGNPVCLWRGTFVDATPMWNDRGDGSFLPTGMSQYLFTGTSLTGATEVTPIGYSTDPDSGRPTFEYESDGLRVTDQLYPDPEGKMLIREIETDSPNPVDFKIMESNNIELMDNGWYVIGDQEFFVAPMDGSRYDIIEVDGNKQLLVKMSSPVKYAIIW